VKGRGKENTIGHIGRAYRLGLVYFSSKIFPWLRGPLSEYITSALYSDESDISVPAGFWMKHEKSHFSSGFFDFRLSRPERLRAYAWGTGRGNLSLTGAIIKLEKGCLI